MSDYITISDFERIFPTWVTTNTALLQDHLDQSESDIANVVKTVYLTDELDRMLPDVREGLRRAVAFQAEYRMHMGPAFFIEGSGTVEGPDYTQKNVPRLAPKARQELLRYGFMSLTGRVR